MIHVRKIFNHKSLARAGSRDRLPMHWNIWAFLALIFISTVVTVALVFVASRKLDGYEIAKTTALAETATKEAVEHVQSLARDYGHWDDAVQNLVIKLDEKWASINVSQSLTENLGITAAFSVNGNDTILHAYCPEPACQPNEHLRGTSAQALLAGALDAPLQQTRLKAAAGDTSGASGFLRFRDSFFAFGLAPIMPLAASFPDYERKIKAGHAAVLLMIVAFNDAYVATVGKSYLLRESHIVEAGAPDFDTLGTGMASLPLQGTEGQVIAALRWRPDLPGADFLALSGGPIFFVCLFVILLGVLFASFLRSTTAQHLAARLRAEEADRAKTQFLAIMSHELRTPLSAVIGFGQLIAQQVLGPIAEPKYKEYADDIVRSGEDLLAIINTILDVSKLEAGKVAVDLQPISLQPVVEEAIHLLREKATEAQLSLTFGQKVEAPVLADALAAKRAVLNILANAIKFTPHGGRIEIAMRNADKRMIDIEITDTGIGIPVDQQDAVFIPFTQVKDAMTRNHGGAGLGLSIVKSLMALQGGSVHLRSAVGAGTTVTLRFRRAAPLESGKASLIEKKRAAA